VTSTGSSVYVSLYSTVVGDVTASTTVHGGSGTQFNQCVRSTGSYTITLHSSTVTAGACCGAVGTCGKACISASPKPPDCSTLHHLELRHASGTGLTCTPSTVTVVACGNADCSTLVTTGVSGTLSASGAGQTVNWPSGAGFVIPSGSSSVNVSFQQTTAGTVTLGATATTPTASAATSCNFGSPACGFTSADSGLLLGVPHHVSGTAQTLSITAVKKSTSTAECTPAFANVTKTVSLSCAHTNPSSGYRAVVVGGLALNLLGLPLTACDGTARPYLLNFNAAGVATPSLQYDDVGQVRLSASHTGSGSSAGLSMTGTTSFVAAPSSFLVSGVTLGPIRAGNPFAATVMARNALNVATPNFGKESAPEGVRLSWAKYQPTGAGASAGSFSGTGVGAGASLTGFNLGLATVSDLKWSEVGTGDLSAVLASGNYLGSGLSASGSTGSIGAVGVFIPHHFDLSVTQGCGLFTYSGQPFSLGLTARNATGGTTANYNGGGSTTPALARLVTLSAVSNGALGSFTSGTGNLASTVFNAGVATVSNVAFTFTNKLTPPATIVVRALDADGVSSSPLLGGTDVSVPLRSGRLRLTNAFGSEKSPLTLVAQAQHWSASKTWVLNSLDSCSLVPVAAVALGNYLGAQGSTAAGWTTGIVPDAGGRAMSIANGGGTLTLAAPTSTNGKAPVGTVDVSLNLGATASDSSCLALPRPSTTGANLSWLRAQFGSSNGCLGAVDYLRDPSARATFGVYAPEVKRLIHATEGP
jgi:MSHA biogenesis protein MshQ